MAFQVSGFQPDLFSFGEWGELPMEVGFHDLVSEVMGGKGFIMGCGKGL